MTPSDRYPAAPGERVKIASEAARLAIRPDLGPSTLFRLVVRVHARCMDWAANQSDASPIGHHEKQ